MDSGSVILSAQKEPDAIQLLAAQRQLYSEEKFWLVVQFFLALVTSLGAFWLIAIDAKYTSQANAVAFFVAALDCFGIQYLLGRKKKSAAQTQESFDCKVLALEWKVGDKPLPELLIAASDRLPAKAKEEIKDWYLGRLDEVPFSVSRIICQITNITYDNAVRKQYLAFLISALVVLLIITVGIGIRDATPINKLLSDLLFPLLPGITFAALQIKEHLQATARLNKLRERTDSLWNECKQKEPDDKTLSEGSRELQNKIFEHRSESATVFDLVYKVCRGKQEKYGEALANHLVDEYKRTKKLV